MSSPRRAGPDGSDRAEAACRTAGRNVLDAGHPRRMKDTEGKGRSHKPCRSGRLLGLLHHRMRSVRIGCGRSVMRLPLATSGARHASQVREVRSSTCPAPSNASIASLPAASHPHTDRHRAHPPTSEGVGPLATGRGALGHLDQFQCPNPPASPHIRVHIRPARPDSTVTTQSRSEITRLLQPRAASLHTREVGGSKPPAPITRRAASGPTRSHARGPRPQQELADLGDHDHDAPAPMQISHWLPVSGTVSRIRWKN